ncbi:hypothetical protein DDB_G0276793 [Dictyostelium discoideum AX4]|uniref:Transmembrane protein n=1 Tax=Dictyostelium discoideum TaxID=44689 RepID=Q7KWW7_DICDI|nr:hypothetical protein DDB_G0276793 [Dictyostelium discoideum AX4]EAL68898.1 hypothetical protein DDB_G0276793 [Dictyostelium discoideum AX4]|eukprot:XP_642877.1 hypothetical protein DDB_G0276793 [Dictyostelium discoideum AX4]
MVLDFLKGEKVKYDKLPEPNEVGDLMKNIKKLADSDDNIIREAARKFGVCIPTEFCRVLLFTSLSKKSVLKHFVNKIQRLVELFVTFFKLVSKFNRDATEISLDTHYENANLEIKSNLNDLENIHSQLIVLANEIIGEIDECINECKREVGSKNHFREPILLKSMTDSSACNTPLLKSKNQFSNEHIKSLTQCILQSKSNQVPNIQKLIDKNNLKKILLNSGGIFFLVMGCATVVVGAVLAPFTAGISLFTALVSIFMIAGGALSLVGGVAAEVLGNKFFIEKDLDLLNSLQTLKEIKSDVEEILKAFSNNSQLADQLSKNFLHFKMGEYGSLGILCGICNNVLKDPLFFDDEVNSTKNFCKDCITQYYKSQQKLAGSNNDDDFFNLPNSNYQTFNLKNLQPACGSLKSLIRNSEERYDEWQRKLLSMIGNNTIYHL